MNNDVQKAILKVAKEVHSICVNNGIEYFMLGGTFLGAIRHKGFIPWDDDIDFGMTLPNYRKFINIVKNMNHPWLTFDIPSVDNKEYYKLFLKAYDKNTTMLEEQRNERDAKGVFIDIFPVGYAGNTKKEAWKVWKNYNFWRSLLDRKRYVLFKDFNLKDRFLRITSKFYSHDYLIRKGFDIIEKSGNAYKEYVIIYDGTENEITLSCYYEEPFVLYQFEDTHFYGIKDYDGYLTSVFKDYMQLPPEDKRVGVHLKFCNLNLPYEEYRKNLSKVK